MNEQPPAAPTAQSTPLEAVPSTWPGAFGIYKYSKQAVQQNLSVLILFGVVFYAIAVVAVIGIKNHLVGQIVGDVFSLFLIPGLTLIWLAGVRGKRLTFMEALKASLVLLPKMFALLVLMYIIMVVSILLLIIPYFFVTPRILLAPYYLVDGKEGVVGSIKTSWAKTKGNVGKVYGIIGAALAMELLVFTIIGIPFAVYFLIMYSAAFAVLYEFINGAPASTTTAAAPVFNQTPGTTGPVAPAAPTAPVVAPASPAPAANPSVPPVVAPQPPDSNPTPTPPVPPAGPVVS